MITKIGIIHQDFNSRGFLEGILDRLRCGAKLLDPPAAIGTPRVLPRKQAREAWRYFQKKGVQLIVRLTDADGDRWQDVRRLEWNAVPEEAREVWICGVCVNNVEDCLYLNAQHLAKEFDLTATDLRDATQRTDRIKRGITKARAQSNGRGNIVAQYVRDAPSRVFRQWLRDDAFRAFYKDCRDAAAQADCDTPNELDEK